MKLYKLTNENHQTQNETLPEITDEQRVQFAIECALEVYPLWQKYDKEGTWYKWAARKNKETSATLAANTAANAVARIATKNVFWEDVYAAASSATLAAAASSATLADDVRNYAASAIRQSARAGSHV